MAFNTLADVGHRLLVEPAGVALSSEERELLSELRPHSFMFRARNFDFKAPYAEWLEKFSALLSEIRKCVGHKNLLLSIDHEGGRVVRPPRPITRFPYAAQWRDKVAEVSKAMAIELKSLGLNTSWAPVADVLTNPDSKAIGRRAFSGVTEEVVNKSVLMAKTIEANGIAAGAKHFPGYGAVTEDAHFALPTASIPRDEWDKVHLPPFVKLIQQGARFIMTAHVMCPSLDPIDQATLSKPILSDLLRKKLGFKGVVVADALGMGAIRDQIEATATVEKALLAELDLFFVAGDSVDLHTAKNLANQILAAVKEGKVREELFRDSEKRIRIAINSLEQPTPKILDGDVVRQHEALAHQLDPKDEWMNFQYIPEGFD